MDSAQPRSDIRKLIAFTLPMAVFVVLLGVTGVGSRPENFSWLSYPAYWTYPAQTLVCGALLWWFRGDYQLGRPGKVWFALLVGIVVFVLWIAPQQFFGFEPRLIGFDPDLFAAQPALYWGTVAFRFLRLVAVVPLVEEVFWRGFVLRYLISERFTTVAIGTFSWLSFLGVTFAFGLAHSRADWAAALVCGALYNLIAYRTGNLASCVVAHATTNLLLGLWIIQTRQWGFW